MKYLFLCFLLTFSVTTYSQVRYIEVNGTYESVLPADRVSFSIQLKTVLETVEEAKNVNTQKLDNLLKQLTDIGISQTDINVSPITIGKNYTYVNNQRQQEGFYVQVNLSVLLQDLNLYTELTDAFVLNNSIEKIQSSYKISDYEHQHQLAYEKALQLAKTKASYMAKVYEMSLGEVLEIEENSSWSSYSIPFNSVTTENSKEENDFGKVTIRRSVRVKFILN
ncbi:hypothetical protein A8B79_09285 [Balneola sp. EhC07]|uniref:SIMPL domain-containing protein n=1 Tax=Balneola sp. EhC07 TaxID=1849360 RepID=UPI0007F39066|nr:SIMPL domain-containing protein [Balneola sp. EhC07]OAN60705.1 hypothetical protein A8B79_09285 [Balneola sp. EhC07]